MSINRFNPRTDAIQGPIVRALEQIPGCKVVYIKLPVDLLVAYRNRNILMECKGIKAYLTKAQEEFISSWPGEVHVVRSPDQAIRIVVGEKAMA